ncbi:hypothetical protein R6Q59_017526 [Mikania micrantha]
MIIWWRQVYHISGAPRRKINANYEADPISVRFLISDDGDRYEFGVPGFGKTGITASHDLNEETLDALNKHGHEVDAFGIGTYLVTCYAQAVLGCVFTLVEINN